MEQISNVVPFAFQKDQDWNVEGHRIQETFCKCLQNVYEEPIISEIYGKWVPNMVLASEIEDIDIKTFILQLKACLFYVGPRLTDWS